MRTWTLDPATGHLEATEIPQTLNAGSWATIPTRGGVFLSTESAPDGEEPGLFKVEGGVVQRRLIGRFGSSYVSPDGCGLALARYRTAALSSATLQVVDVCRSA